MQLIFYVSFFSIIQANKTFVLMRKNMMETKAAMEETVKLHRESVQGARSIEAEIEVGGNCYKILSCTSPSLIWP